MADSEKTESTTPSARKAAAREKRRKHPRLHPASPEERTPPGVTEITLVSRNLDRPQAR